MAKNPRVVRDSIAQLLKNKHETGIIFLIDVLFFFSVFLIYRGKESVWPAVLNAKAGASATTIGILALLVFVYYLTMMLLLALAKFQIMQRMLDILGKKNMEWDRFWNFYLLNFLIIAILFVFGFFVGYILTTVKTAYLLSTFFILTLPSTIAGIVFMQSAHAFFARGGSVASSLLHGLIGITLLFNRFIGLLAFALSAAAIMIALWIVPLWVQSNAEVSAFSFWVLIISNIVSLIGFFALYASLLVFRFGYFLSHDNARN